jgi:pimeloyl-ACP methyl ester carboxylesterase
MADHLHWRSLKGCALNPVLVFLHEGLGCSEAWFPFAQNLCETLNWPGFLYDRDGYGLSPLALETFPEEYLKNEAAFLVNSMLELTSEAAGLVLVGHSDGASIALLAASLPEARLDGVIALAPHVAVEEVTLEGVRAAVAAHQEGKLSGLKKWHGGKTDQVFWRWANRWLDPEFQHWQMLDRLGLVSCPVLVIQGEEDPYGSERQLHWIQNNCLGPVTVALLPHTGHHPHRQRDHSCLKIMAEWCVRLSGSGVNP